MIAALIADFAANDPDVDVWARYPDVSEAEDEHTDDVDCKVMSERFVQYAHRRGYAAQLVRLTDAPDAYVHYVVALTDDHRQTFVDWTYRQFHNLAEPVLDVRNAPFPFIYTGEALDHPAGFTQTEWL